LNEGYDEKIYFQQHCSSLYFAECLFSAHRQPANPGTSFRSANRYQHSASGNRDACPHIHTAGSAAGQRLASGRPA
jgi:hypothetical protein